MLDTVIGIGGGSIETFGSKHLQVAANITNRNPIHGVHKICGSSANFDGDRPKEVSRDCKSRFDYKTIYHHYELYGRIVLIVVHAPVTFSRRLRAGVCARRLLVDFDRPRGRNRSVFAVVSFDGPVRYT